MPPGLESLWGQQGLAGGGTSPSEVKQMTFGTAAPKSCAVLCLLWDSAGFGDVEVWPLLQPVEFLGSGRKPEGWSKRQRGGDQGLLLCFAGIAPAETTNFVLLNGSLSVTQKQSLGWRSVGVPWNTICLAVSCTR